MHVERKENNFDFIRFIAATFVLITHCFVVFDILPDYDIMYVISNKTHTLSEVGLASFFVLSGFLIYQSYINSKNIVDYFLKRLLRIFPALALIVLISTFIVGPLVSTLGPKAYFQQFSNLLDYLGLMFIFPRAYFLPGVFTDNPQKIVNTSLWTIPYEFFCYMLVPALMFFHKLLKIKSRHVLLGAFIITCTLGALNYIQGWHSFIVPGVNLIFIEVIHFSTLFLSGALLFEYSFLIKKNIKPAWIFGLIGLFIISTHIPKLTLVSVFVFIPIIVLNLSFIKGRLNNFGKYGDFSYGIYLYAFVIQQLIVNFKITDSPIVMFVIAFPLSVLAGAMSWYLVEKKALSYKNVLKNVFKPKTVV